MTSSLPISNFTQVCRCCRHVMSTGWYEQVIYELTGGSSCPFAKASGSPPSHRGPLKIDPSPQQIIRHAPTTKSMLTSKLCADLLIVGSINDPATSYPHLTEKQESHKLPGDIIICCSMYCSTLHNKTQPSKPAGLCIQMSRVCNQSPFQRTLVSIDES